jgi:hypothetical protein
MFRTSLPRGIGKSLSRTALAVALASGMALGAAAISTPAMAKDAKPSNSKAFADAYTPLQTALASATPDYAAAKGLVPGIVAKVQTPHDKFVLGGALVKLGDKLKDTAMEKQGVHLILDSGESSPANLGQLHFYLGQFAMDEKDFATARTEFQAAAAAGYKEVDPEALIAETYFGANQNAEGLTYLSNLIAKRKAAGVAIPDNWYARGLAVAFNAKMVPQSNEFARALLANNPSEENWGKAFTAVVLLNNFDAQSQLDLMRLMRLTGAMKQRQQYAEYVDDTNKYALANETLDVLKEAAAKGLLTPSDPLYVEAQASAQKTAASDRKDTPGVAAEARTAKDGRVAFGAGNAFYSFADYANAEAMFKLAVDKGVPEKDLALTRLGMAQIQQGKFAEGQATLAQVRGPRAPVAQLWSAYAASKAGAKA